MNQNIGIVLCEGCHRVLWAKDGPVCPACAAKRLPEYEVVDLRPAAGGEYVIPGLVVISTDVGNVEESESEPEAEQDETEAEPEKPKRGRRV